MIARPANYMGGMDYIAKLTLYNNQQTQDQVNSKAHDEFVQQAAAWVIRNLDLRDNKKLPTEAPLVPPKKITWNDDGSITTVEFPDLQVTSLPPVVQTTSGGPSLVEVFGQNQNASMSDSQKLDALLMLVNELLGKFEGK